MVVADSPDTFHDRMLSLGLARVSEAAAMAASRQIGRGDEMIADGAAIEAMRIELNLLDIDGTIVIGEGEREQTQMLFVGEKVGNGKGDTVDIALDPLEGSTLTAKALPNAMSIVAMAPRHSMLRVPEIYMDKLAIGPGYPEGIIDLDMPPAERVRVFAKAKGGDPDDVTVCVLERPRHAKLIAEIRSTGASIRLISDGDVAGVMHCSRADETGIDMYMGSGGAGKGVLAAAALKCLGGQIQGRLVCRSRDEVARAHRAGFEDLDKKLNRDDMIRSGVLFSATGVTDSAILRGARREREFLETETLLMRSRTGSVRRISYRTNYF
jgi:fructose-1,6-bisphosphatase II / sedoheptulose-1,7-bisphosphatase